MIRDFLNKHLKGREPTATAPEATETSPTGFRQRRGLGTRFSDDTFASVRANASLLILMARTIE